MNTKSNIKPCRQFLNLAVLGSGTLAPASATAADLYWACGSAAWDAACWSATSGGTPAPGQPQNGDTVNLAHTGSTNLTVDYQNTAYPSAVLNSLSINTAGIGSMTFSQTKDALAATTETIGSSGLGAWNPSAGTWNSSIATFNQSGGTHTVSYLQVGVSGDASYNLSGTGSLSANFESLGAGGIGDFNQSGGTHTVSYLQVGTLSGGSGGYNLSAGSLSAGNISLGEGGGGGGPGSFYQAGGTLTANRINMNKGIYSLNAGNLSAGSVTITGEPSLGWGYGWPSSFTQAGGTHTVNGLEIGYGSYSLNAGSLTATNETIGHFYGSYTDGTFGQSGGTHTVTGSLTIGQGTAYNSSDSGSYNLYAGTLTATNEIIGAYGTGTFTQAGGTNTVTSNLILGHYAGSNGTYNLDGGVLNVGNIVYGAGKGVFNYNSGTLNVTGNSVALNTFVSNSNFTLGSGQTLTAADGITNNANGSFTVGAGATVAAGGLGLVNYGLLGGTGTVVGNVISSGNVGPGNSPGMLSITGNYTQSASGIFTAEVGGLLAGTQYDVLNVSGTAFLDGLLNVSLYNLGGGMFRPHAGDYFDIFTASILQGSFSTLSFAALSDPNLFWRIDYLTDAIGTTDVVRLSIVQNAAPPAPVPEPETYAMLLAGLGLMGVAGRRRRNSAA